MYPEGQQILVIVADRECRDRVARILGDEGFDVTTAAEGLTALRTVAARRFALVIAATHLPGTLDGITTVRQARARQPWLKALYLDDGPARRTLGTTEADDVIAGPFERHELIGCTFEMLQRGFDRFDDLTRRARTELRAS